MTKQPFNHIKTLFLKHIPQGCSASLRFVRDEIETLHVRQDILQPLSSIIDQGIMVTVYKGNGMGYGATCNLTEAGIQEALQQAERWADISSNHSLINFADIDMNHACGSYESCIEQPWQQVSIQDKLDLLQAISGKLKISDEIVNWETSLCHTGRNSYFITSEGAEIHQEFNLLVPDIIVTANQGSETQKRTLDGMMALSQQGGYEILASISYQDRAVELAEEALELLHADNCPSGTMDLVLDPSQMMLQIHESIGHPLEIDRILGDERNYAGTSFVKPEMIGSYQYGSELLNITFDPTLTNQLASYAYDDDGAKAEKEFIIRDGVLQRGLGGTVSQIRSGLPGVANSRACSWNRPPIDRMANLNLEPGHSSFDDIISSVDKGVFMTANSSWSIDDSRNKFQFGCEKGILIKNGKLTKTVKNPNYRGISATFWRNLKMVGDKSTFQKMGTPNCGKGEPNQVITVGHASPTALFANVDIFGGE